jgi:hypothetical protein
LLPICLATIVSLGRLAFRFERWPMPFLTYLEINFAVLLVSAHTVRPISRIRLTILAGPVQFVF